MSFTPASPMTAGGRLHEAPFDVFVEIVPILELVPDTDVGLEAAFGGHYYFYF